MKRTLGMIVVMAFGSAGQAVAQEGFGSLEGALEQARARVASDATTLKSRGAATGSNPGQDGWPVLVDSDGRELPFTRTPARPLEAHPRIDVQAINRQLAEAGVEAAVYQVVPGPDGQVPNRPPFTVVYRGGGCAPLPFGTSRLEVLGSVLVAESPSSRRYLDVAGGAKDGRLETLGVLEREATGRILAVRSTRPVDVGYKVLADILRCAEVGEEDGRLTLLRVRELHARFGTDYELSGSREALLLRFAGGNEARVWVGRQPEVRRID
ncbi:MAG: hypothetical protein HY553_18860 [Elusimicrobia bacterium]|nr:hypothetical protein [Elusimicrobiota bacterium]